MKLLALLLILCLISCGGSNELSAEQKAQQLRWCASPPMLTARYQATATKMLDGRILLVGGRGVGALHLDSAEIFDPTTNSWMPAGTLNEARYYHTATLLMDGRILIAGGINAEGVLASVEVFDPKTTLWKVVGRLHNARREHTAFLSNTGKVYVIGGGAPYQPQSSVESFDPLSETWSFASSLPAGQANATSISLNGNYLYNIGGYQDDLATGPQFYVFDPMNGTWEIGPTMQFAREYFSANILNNSIIVVGGYSDGSVLDTIENFDLSLPYWTTVGKLKTPTWGHLSFVIGGAGILIVGGVGSDMNPKARTEFIQPGKPSILTNAISVERYGFFMTALDDGRVLIGGGAQTYNAVGNSWLASTEITCQSIN
jgi:N-acetylneuraminic acid mutarotase